METEQKLFVKFIQGILETKQSVSIDELIVKFVDFSYSELISPKKQKLIQTAFSQKLNQQKLDDLLKDFDIEVAAPDEVLLFSYVMKLYPELNFDKYSAPRLSGLLRYYRFKNLSLMAHYSKIVKALNENGIVPMILKGGAMKYLRPDLSRIMGDIDILVKKDDFQRVFPIIKSLGYCYEDSQHSVDLHLSDSDEGICDIHRYLDVGSDYPHKFMKELFSRASQHTVFNVESFLPCPEDMVFIALTNMYRNIRNSNSINGIIFTLFDIDYLLHLQKNFDWSIVLDDVKKTNSYLQVYIATSFINKTIPDFLPLDIFSDKKIKKIVSDYYYHDVFYVKYVAELKYICKKLRFSQAIKNWTDFKYYLSKETRHFFLKRILKSPTIVRFFLTCFNGNKIRNK